LWNVPTPPRLKIDQKPTRVRAKGARPVTGGTKLGRAFEMKHKRGLEIIATVSLLLGWVIGTGVLIASIYFAYLTSFISLISTLVLPMFAPFYWSYWLWANGAGVINLYTIACGAFVACVVVHGLIREGL
jgi:hypothetical protein